MVFDASGAVLASAQQEFTQIFPEPGWVEHDPVEIWAVTEAVIASALSNAGLSTSDLAAVGITNQRETTVAWDRSTGAPLANAIVWQDTRTAAIADELAGGAGIDRFRATTGLPLATYFSGPKMTWLLRNVDISATGNLALGTIDSWVLWNLTGGVDGGLHVTDVSNAGRTMLMDLGELAWSDTQLAAMEVPADALAEIKPSIGRFGVGTGVLDGVPISCVLGDQHAALFGQACFDPGEAKNTYGTGCFMLMNTGPEAVPSEHGLLTTLGYQIEGEPAVYALEGSIAIAGALVQWLRDNLGLITDSSEIEALAAPDNGDVYIVPAFSGLFAPHWRDDARGAIVGLTRYADRTHIARAALEATAFQTREVLDAMNADSGVDLSALKVDGGMTVNETLMQFQADVLDVPVVRPVVNETTALGAAYGAGLAEGYWDSLDDLRANWQQDARWDPAMEDADRTRLYRRWQQAVERTLDWA